MVAEYKPRSNPNRKSDLLSDDPLVLEDTSTQLLFITLTYTPIYMYVQSLRIGDGGNLIVINIIEIFVNIKVWSYFISRVVIENNISTHGFCLIIFAITKSELKYYLTPKSINYPFYFMLISSLNLLLIFNFDKPSIVPNYLPWGLEWK